MEVSAVIEKEEINVFPDNSVKDEPPLTPAEEERLKQVTEDKVIKKLSELYDRVISIKKVIENDDFVEIFIKPIRGNIAEIKAELENVEKSRDLAVLQGKLFAYRKMLNFPETAVSALELEVEDVRRTMPLFYGANEFVKKCSKVKLDSNNYKITIG